MKKLFLFFMLAILPVSLISQPQPVPRPAVEGILEAFGQYNAVALGEHHDLIEEFDLYEALITRPGFTKTVRHIVVEYANARYQSVLDRFVAGEHVNEAELVKIWRDNTQGASLIETASFQRLLEVIRTRNRGLASEERIKVLAGDPPIDWSGIEGESSLMAWMYRREKHYAQVAKQVLDEGKKVLLIMGATHFYKSAPSSVVGRLEKSHPGETFVIYPAFGFGKLTAEVESRLKNWERPSVADVRDNWLGQLEADAFLNMTILNADEKNVETPSEVLKMDKGQKGKDDLIKAMEQNKKGVVIQLDEEMSEEELLKLVQQHGRKGKKENEPVVPDLPPPGELQKWMLEQHAKEFKAGKEKSSQLPAGDFFKSKTGKSPFEGMKTQDLFDAILYFGPYTDLNVEGPKADLYEDDSFWKSLDEKHKALYGKPVAPWVREAFKRKN